MFQSILTTDLTEIMFFDLSFSNLLAFTTCNSFI